MIQFTAGSKDILLSFCAQCSEDVIVSFMWMFVNQALPVACYLMSLIADIRETLLEKFLCLLST